MVNYKRVVCEVALLAALVGIVAAAPAPDCHEKHYDQSQNGTENYRLNIDGVVIAVAPVESFLAATSGIDFGEILEELELQKPKPPSQSSPSKPEASPADDEKPQESKPEAPEKPEAPLSDVALKPETKGQKKETGRKPLNGQSSRLKTLITNVLIPLLRRHAK